MTILLLVLILGVLVWAALGAESLTQRLIRELQAITSATREMRDRMDAEAADRAKRMELLATQRGIGRELLAQRLAARLAEKKALQGKGKK